MIERRILYLVPTAVLATMALILAFSVNFSGGTVENTGGVVKPPSVPSAPIKPEVTPPDEEEVTPPSEAEEDYLTFISKRGYISEGGFPTIVGEVKNTGNFKMENMRITATFYCSSGKLIGEKDNRDPG